MAKQLYKINADFAGGMNKGDITDGSVFGEDKIASMLERGVLEKVTANEAGDTETVEERRLADSQTEEQKKEEEEKEPARRGRKPAEEKAKEEGTPTGE